MRAPSPEAGRLRPRRAAPRCARLLGALLLLSAGPAWGFVLAEEPLEERSTELGVMARSFAFVLRGLVLEPPYTPGGESPLGLSISDLRLSFAHRRPKLKLTVHNQLSLRLSSTSSGAPVALGRGVEPLRWLPLQAELADQQGLLLQETVDWVYLAYSWGPLTATLGRQPISFGRGKLWRPTDLVSTFALTEVDTEYKPGTDALRLDFSLGQQRQLTAVAAAGKWQDQLALRGSSFVVQAKQGWDRGELGLLAGYVRRDLLLGLDGVLDAGGFDLYAETTLTLVTADSLTPRRPETGRAVLRGVAGATFKPQSKLTISPELYVNGFGAWDKEAYPRVALSDRVAIGELYTLGMLYCGVTGLWEAHPLLRVSWGGIANLRDPSGLLLLGLTYNAASNVEVLAGSFLPLGRIPELDPFRPRGEFGLYPTLVYLELKVAM